MIELFLSSSPNHSAQPTDAWSPYQPGRTMRHTSRSVSATISAVSGTEMIVMIATSNSISKGELSRVGSSEPSSASRPSAGRNAARPSSNSSPRLAAKASAQKPGRVGAGGSVGQCSPASPSLRPGAPPQRSPAPMAPVTTVPGSISAPAPITAPGLSIEREPIRAPAPISIAPTTSSCPSIHQPRMSTLPSTVAPSPTVSSAPAGGTVARRAPSPTFAPTSRA